MSEGVSNRRWVGRAASLTLVLLVALGLRLVAAGVVTRYAASQGKLCVFADTDIYWKLAGAIVAGEPFQVGQWGVPHYALRTPGYPLFLAACRATLGDGLFGVRAVQAILGTLAVWLLARLAGATISGDRRERWAVPLIAASLAAVDPCSSSGCRPWCSRKPCSSR